MSEVYKYDLNIFTVDKRPHDTKQQGDRRSRKACSLIDRIGGENYQRFDHQNETHTLGLCVNIRLILAVAKL